MTNAEPGPLRGWRKAVFKIPVFLARIGFAGWESLFGLEWLLLITTGRKSGKKRYAMVDVLQYDRETDTRIIEAGFGKSSDWYRNIQASPWFEARAGRRTFRAVAEAVPPDNCADLLVSFVRSRPVYAKAAMKMAGSPFTTEEELRRTAPGRVLLAIHPQK